MGSKKRFCGTIKEGDDFNGVICPSEVIPTPGSLFTSGKLFDLLAEFLGEFWLGCLSSLLVAILVKAGTCMGSSQSSTFKRSNWLSVIARTTCVFISARWRSLTSFTWLASWYSCLRLISWRSCYEKPRTLISFSIACSFIKWHLGVRIIRGTRFYAEVSLNAVYHSSSLCTLNRFIRFCFSLVTSS